MNMKPADRYSSNSNKDSGGNDRWEGVSTTLSNTGSAHSFVHYSKTFTFTLVDSTAAVPRPEGTFEVGKFSTFSLSLSVDNRNAGDPTGGSLLALDNLALRVNGTLQYVNTWD